MKKKLLSLTGIIILILILIVAGGIWYWNTHKKKIIRDKLETAIREKSDGLYKVDYTNLEMDEASGNLSVSSFILKYDSLKYVQLEKEKNAPYLLFTITIPHIKVTGVETPRALLEKEITGRHLAIENPVIEIIYTHAGKDSTRNIPDKEIYEQILGNLNLIKLDSVTISGAKITTKDLRSGKTSVRFTNTSISLVDVAVDSAANADSTRLLFAKEINLDCERFSWQSEDHFYDYQVDSISFRSEGSNITIKNFLVKPLLSESEFVKKAPFQTDRLDFIINNIQLKNTDFLKLNEEVIKADTMIIGSASFKLYRDRNMRRDRKNRVGTYPQQVIKKLPVEIDIAKGILKNTFIEYKEKSSITNQPGYVRFWNLSATISNITNIKSAIAKNDLMTFDVHTRFLNKVPLYTKWTFYLDNSDGRFKIKGNLGSADASTYNELAVPMGPARFKSGHVKSLEFDLSGTNYKMTGTVKLLYDDLHVALLEKDKDSVHFNKKTFTSLLANFKIKNSNPEKNKDPRIANLDFPRDTNKSIFNLAWKSLFDAIKEITGAK